MHGAVGQWLAYAADVAQVSVIVFILVVLNLITLNACVLNVGKLGEISGLNTVLVSVENLWYSCHLFLLLMSLLIRDVADLEEVSFWKPDKILVPSVLLACKQAELIVCILPSLLAVSASGEAGVGICEPFKQSASLDTVVSCECVVCVM